jgi:ferredoxin
LRDPLAELVAVRRHRAGSVTLMLRPNEHWGGFRAGQFVRLTVEVDGVRETRCHSPAYGENRRVPSDGRSLLEQAEQAGLRPPCGCRMGICRICTCRKTTGRVRNVLSGELSSTQDEDVQICVSAPVGDVEIAL